MPIEYVWEIETSYKLLGGEVQSPNLSTYIWLPHMMQRRIMAIRKACSGEGVDMISKELERHLGPESWL